jgi:DNA helicase TIP49 (TBP-interacting protein)
VLSNHRVHYAVASEFGQEAEDSPMAGGAVYGLSPSLDEALNQALLKAGC